MRDVNEWLLALSFLLGLLLTFAMMIRRVTREVPVNGVAAARTVPATATAATMPQAGAVAKSDDIVEKEPYGAGSVRVSARTVAPVGYTIKGDKDTGRYFTPDSPQYAAIEAEVWFADEESAAKAGFLRWDGKGTESRGGADASLVIVESGSAEVDSALRIVADPEDGEPRRS